MFSKLNFKLDKDRSVFKPKVYQVWFLLLSIFVFLLLIISGIHLYIYFYLQDVDRVLGPENGEIILDQRSLDQALEVLSTNSPLIDTQIIEEEVLGEEIDQTDEL